MHSSGLLITAIRDACRPICIPACLRCGVNHEFRDAIKLPPLLPHSLEDLFSLRDCARARNPSALSKDARRVWRKKHEHRHSFCEQRPPRCSHNQTRPRGSAHTPCGFFILGGEKFARTCALPSQLKRHVLNSTNREAARQNHSRSVARPSVFFHARAYPFCASDVELSSIPSTTMCADFG